MSVKTVLQVDIKATEARADDLGNAEKIHAFVKSLTMATGTSASQSDKVWSDRRSLAATTEELDLAAGLTGALGDSLTFAKVTLIAIHNRNTTAGEVLTLGGAAANGFETMFGAAGDKIKIGPNGWLILFSPVDGFAVTADTADLLKLDAGAATISYDIIIVGRSA
jgi:hypothetical protein